MYVSVSLHSVMLCSLANLFKGRKGGKAIICPIHYPAGDSLRLSY